MTQPKKSRLSGSKRSELPAGNRTSRMAEVALLIEFGHLHIDMLL